MRIIFAGTPQFAVESMAALHNSNHELIGVYCQPDRPKGRGKILTACPVKVYAEKNKLPLFQPEKFSDSSNEELLAIVQRLRQDPKCIEDTKERGYKRLLASRHSVVDRCMDALEVFKRLG